MRWEILFGKMVVPGSCSYLQIKLVLIRYFEIVAAIFACVGFNVKISIS